MTMMRITPLSQNDDSSDHDDSNQEPEDTRPTRPQRIRRKPENTHSQMNLES